MVEDPYATGVLVPTVHDESFIRRIPEFSARAGVPNRYIMAKASEANLGPLETKWLVDFNLHESIGGMMYVGSDFNPPVLDRMMVLTGVLIRNFIDARIVFRHDLIDRLRKGDDVSHSCVLIPDFSGQKVDTVVEKSGGLLLSYLARRRSAGLQTVVGVFSPDAVEKEYGKSMRSFMESYYVAVF